VVRYLSGLCICGLGLVAGGWVAVAAVLLRGVPSNATLVSASTGAGVGLVSAVGIGCWWQAWRQRMRLDGVLAARAGRARPGQARRTRRALRRDMRRAARTARRDGAPQTASTAPAAVPVPPAVPVPVGPVPSASAVPMGSAAPAGGAGPAGGTLRPGGGCPAGSPAVVLTELRAILEPLLTTGPMEAVPGADADGEETW
jgi:hypothetical protein